MDKIDDCLCSNLRRTTLAVNHYYDKLLAPSGLKSTQFSLLTRIRQRQTISVGELAEETSLDRTTMGKNLQLLAKSGWITLGPGEDKRERVAQLTPAGEEALEIATPLWHQAQHSMYDVLGGEGLRAFRGLLGELEQATS